MKPNAYTTMQAARALRERQPEASPSHVTIALALASFADGPTGTSIRPGYARLAEVTGLHRDTVKDGVRWLVERGELRRDKTGWRGSAACVTWLGGMGGSDTTPSDVKGGSQAAIGRGLTPPPPITPLRAFRPYRPSGCPWPAAGGLFAVQRSG